MTTSSKLIIGLTGGIGSGKTAVSDRFAHLDITIIDADIASRIVVEAQKPALKAISDHFGENILLANGELDRAQLRARIFQHPEEKQWLESLLHPLIREEIIQQLQRAVSPYAILVSPLLFESKQDQLCDRTLIVDVPEQTQINRTAARDNNDVEQIKRIIASQISRKERLSKADDIIENTQSYEHLDQQISQLHQRYLALS